MGTELVPSQDIGNNRFTVQLHDIEIVYFVEIRDVKSCSISFCSNAWRVVVPAKDGRPYEQARRLVSSNAKWIYEKTKLINEARTLLSNDFFQERTEEEFKELTVRLANLYAGELNLARPRIRFTDRFRRKYGHCKRGKEVAMGMRARHYPEDVVRYIVYHEMLHNLFHRHDGAFRKMMVRRFPDILQIEKKMIACELAEQLQIERET